MDKKDISLFRYRGCIPEILRYQIITKSCLAVMAFLLRYARGAVLWTTSRSAVTSGDLPFLMTTIQGWIVIALAILMLILYMVIDINAMIILSSRVLHQKPVKIRPILTEAVQSLKLFRDGTGVFLLLFVSFLIPLAGIGLGISLTEKFYIPDFITSVINSNVIYSVLYHAGLLLV
ncbi:MAG: glycerophosphoryl diester phosphodiesterase membrane domain-containing protein, partial [Lachnospiraceae bacterium]|nr:glycerophosphoryl diester phosphodiesterase membrane domain-containing protein [Lachnospiraceae bacterium]